MSEFNPQQLAQYDTVSNFAQGYGLARNISRDISARNANVESKAALEGLIKDPSPKNILAVSLKYPQLSEGIKSAFENMDIEERKRRIEMAIPVYSASLSGRGDIAKKLLLQQASAMEASGGDPEEIARLKEKAELAVDDPATFQRDVGTALAHGMGEKYFAQSFAAIEAARGDEKLLPYKQYESLAKAEKDTATAAIDQAKAPYAADMAAAQLEVEQQKPWDVRADNSTNAAQAKAALEFNKLKSDEISLATDEKKRAIEEKKIQKEAAFNEGQAVVDVTMQHIKDALAHPSLEDTPFYRAATGTLPNSSAREFKKALSTIDANNFIAAMTRMKEQGLTMGQLTEKEGEVLKSQLGMLDPLASNEYNAKILADMYKTIDRANKRAIATRVKMRAAEKGSAGTKPGMIPMPDDFNEIMGQQKKQARPGYKLQINKRTGKIREVPAQ
ncbi:MAG: hypothetical protein M0P59_14445 [Gallionella sp.]|jgi:hypothetical protein|nr:hypothetical protein [Gallionella sp.]